MPGLARKTMSAQARPTSCVGVAASRRRRTLAIRLRSQARWGWTLRRATACASMHRSNALSCEGAERASAGVVGRGVSSQASKQLPGAWTPGWRGGGMYVRFITLLHTLTLQVVAPAVLRLRLGLGKLGTPATDQPDTHGLQAPCLSQWANQPSTHGLQAPGFLGSTLIRPTHTGCKPPDSLAPH